MKIDFSFNPNKSFIKLHILWLIIVIIFIIAIIISTMIICNSNIILNLSYEGFNNFLSIFRVPLGVLTLIIPIVALMAANHRSEQTKHQIKVSNEQNIFANHFKHLQEHGKLLNRLTTEEITFPDPRKMHNKLYPKTMENELTVNQTCLIYIEDKFDKIHSNLNTISSSKDKSIITNIINIDKEIFELHDYLYIKDIKGYGSYPQYTSKEKDFNQQIYKTSHETLLGWLRYLDERLSCISEILSLMPDENLKFLRKYKTLRKTSFRTNIDIENLQVDNLSIDFNPYQDE